MKKKIFLTPYNKPARALAQILDKNSNLDIAFIDSYKYDNRTIFEPLSLTNEEFEKIVIVSTSFYKEIYQTLQKYSVAKEKIYFYDSITNRYIHSLLSYKTFLIIQTLHQNTISILSTYKLKKYKNKHINKRCFILGNGPSLSIEDLDKLKSEVTFASNKIYLAFEQTEWRPNYYFVEDHLVLQQNYTIIKNLKGFEKFFPTISLGWVPKFSKSLYYKLIYNFNEPSFSDDPNKGFFWGASVTHSMIEMAVYMGFKEIYLLGIDFNFLDSDTKINIGNSGVFLANGEQNHFHKEYRKTGEQWTVPDMEFQKRSFEKAKEFCEAKEIKIFNCSRKTKLDVLEKSTLEEILRS